VVCHKAEGKKKDDTGHLPRPGRRFEKEGSAEGSAACSRDLPDRVVDGEKNMNWWRSPWKMKERRAPGNGKRAWWHHSEDRLYTVPQNSSTVGAPSAKESVESRNVGYGQEPEREFLRGDEAKEVKFQRARSWKENTRRRRSRACWGSRPTWGGKKKR